MLLTFLTCSAMKSPLLIFFSPPLFCVLPPEAATKYTKAEHLTLRARLARLNTHSIAKKTTRLSRLLMHEAGIVAKVGSPHCTPAPAAPPWAVSGAFCCSWSASMAEWGGQGRYGVGWLVLPPGSPSSQGALG